MFRKQQLDLLRRPPAHESIRQTAENDEDHAKTEDIHEKAKIILWCKARREETEYTDFIIPNER